MEISAIADDTVKFEHIIPWCASNPDGVPLRPASAHGPLRQARVANL
jgi:hypothetical protein